MAKNDTSLTPDKRKDMPPRGKGKQTVILDAIKDKALLGLGSESTRDDAEKAIFGFMAESAFNPTVDTAVISTTCLTLLMKKGWPDVKSTSPCIEFDFDKDAKPHVQASQVMKAAADGLIPPDIANMFVSSIASMMKIQEVTDIEDRLNALEAIENEKD